MNKNNNAGSAAVLDKHPFLTDVKTLRDRARRHIKQGVVTSDYEGDLQTVIKVLNDALATEIICVLRYKRHQYAAKGIHARSVAAEFAEHAAEELGHADKLAQRIVQLGGEPNYSPEGLVTRSRTEYTEDKDLTDMIKENLVAERIAVESYREIIRYVGEDDATTRVMLEGILEEEEEHAEDLASLLQQIGRDYK